ncbi:aldose epimerase family protein [Virgibacillus siamensis]|uniref:aldose epimerase family protein n=1 Tax=Virgibacillus siamensis TaxID=480071 RepID=UPI000984C068|nr:aldose epimerase family protein [Virgibacillus siamensis]
MNITENVMTVQGETWREFTLFNDSNMEVSILNFGGIISRIITPDRHGNVENVVLGFENYRDYAVNPAFFGAIIGRVAGRIPNAAFTINNQAYYLDANDGKNHLHGGPNGFHHKLWNADPYETKTTVGVRLSLDSPDMESGYPGNVRINVCYELDNHNRLRITYHAEADRTTPLALTNHTYFNLSGNVTQSVANHHITMKNAGFAELDQEFIPTGSILDPAGTPFDFSSGRPIQDGIQSIHPQNKIVGNGYDHYFLFEKNGDPDVTVYEPESGRTLTVTTNEPGLVLYTSNNLDDGLKLDGGESGRYAGVCLETQKHPAALTNSNFPSILVTPDQPYHTTTTFTINTK